MKRIKNALEHLMLICGIYFTNTNSSDVAKFKFSNVVKYKVNPPHFISFDSNIDSRYYSSTRDQRLVRAPLL